MAKRRKKSSSPAKQEHIDLGNAPGVAPLVIDEIDKAVTKYERAKDKRCAESPAEVTYKRELRAILHARRDELHTDPETGERFYRVDGKDYVLSEKLSIRKVDEGESVTSENI